MAAVNTIGAATSSCIGDAYGNNKIGPISHKIFHAAVGTAEGGMLNGKNGAIAGLIGAGVAETIADICGPKPPSLDDIVVLEKQIGRSLTPEEVTYAWNAQLLQYFKRANVTAEISKSAGALTALIANKDIDIAYNTASQAVDHNFLALTLYGIVGATTAYEIYKAYQNKGIEGALTQLGIEIKHNAVGLAVGCVASPVVFKVGTKIYPSMQAAITAVLDVTPGLRSALGNFTDTLFVAGEKLAQTTIGKQVGRLGDALNRVETKLISAEQKVAQKVGQQFNSCAENVVEHVVPDKVLSKVDRRLAKETAKGASKAAKNLVPEVALSQKSISTSEQDVLKTANQKVTKIQHFSVTEDMKDHIFSGKHIDKGIMDLGDTKESIISKFVEIVQEADSKNLLLEGPNNIVKKLNGMDVTVRVFIKEGKVVSFNGFKGLSDRGVLNKIYL